MSQRMEQGMRQSMVASASMQMYMRALQANSTELEQMVSEAISTNPVLEEDRSRDFSPINEDAQLATERHERFLKSLTEECSLTEHLEEQIMQSGLTEEVEELAFFFVQQLNAHAFFEENPAELAAQANFKPELVKPALKALHDLEPAGVGARNLQESLLIQLRHLGEGKGIAAELITHHWDCLVNHRYTEAAKRMEMDEPAIRGAALRISKLNPDPGSGFCRTEQLVITPDVLVEREGEKFKVRLNKDNAPQLTLSADYRSMMAERAENAELRRYLSKCFKAGRELMQALAMRQQSILEVSRAITVRQHAFFMEGPHALRPLKMEQIAEDCDMHVSTVSRAVRHKYLRCEHGLYELRRFFNAALSQQEGEEDISANSIQAKIRKLIDDENKAKPLSDAKIEKALQAEGIQVARRTIAKYREQMKILPASLRKGH